jgi:hypothetical protein
MGNLLKKIKAGQANRRRLRWPGTDIDIELRLLSVQDSLDASLAADRLYKDNENAVGFHNVSEYQLEKTIQQLYRACVEPGTNTPVVDSIAEFRRLVNGRERDMLVDEYSALDSECNPSPDTMSADEFDALVQNLKKKPSETTGSISSLSTLRRLCTFLASQPAHSPADSGCTSM